MVKQLYKFDVFVEVDGSEGYKRAVRFLSHVKGGDAALRTSQALKGLLRIVL